MDWVLIYSDLSTFSSDDGAWEDAPGGDVQMGLFRDSVTGMWTIRHGGQGGSPCDYFRKAESGEIVGMDEDGMKHHVVHVLGTVKQGRMLSKARWASVLRFGMELRNQLREQDGPG